MSGLRALWMVVVALIAVGGAEQVAHADPSALDTAYQKEYAYLRAEHAELQARLAEVDRESEQRIAAADAQITELQAKLVAMTRDADRAEEGLDAIGRESAALGDATATLATTVDQASEELGLPPVAADADPATAVPALFAAAARAIEDGRRSGAAPGAFFLADGRAVDGTVYRWGRIAAWGTSPHGVGALAPAGEGRLQIRAAGDATATALVAGQAPDALSLYLFEPEQGAAEAEKAGGLGKLLDDAGAMGKVLFGLGCVSACLVVVRAITLAFARRGGNRLVDEVERAVLADDLARARASVRANHPTARTLRAILDAADRPAEELLRVVDAALLLETPRIDRFASALVVITAGSPLLGLLGTVTGMIATFDVITEHGTGNPKLMSAGIAEALVCTALGLSVAIPTLLAGNVLASVATSVKNTLERGALRTLNALDRRPLTVDRLRETA